MTTPALNISEIAIVGRLIARATPGGSAQLATTLLMAKVRIEVGRLSVQGVHVCDWIIESIGG